MIEQMQHLKGLAYSASCTEHTHTHTRALSMMINCLFVCMGEVGRENDFTENKPLHILDAKPAENHSVFSACNETADSG